MSTEFDFVIVGAGIVGLATAYKLQRKYPDQRIAVLEKESCIGKHQTGRNSGVIHSGIYYRPGSYKAKNCSNGREQLVHYAKEFDIPHDVCGKIIVATDESELPILDAIFEKGKLNETPGIKYLNTKEIKEKEPFIEGIKAIWVPSAGIIDYVKLGASFMDEVIHINANSKLYLSCKVNGVDSTERTAKIKTNKGIISAKKVIFCAGLQSDRKARNDKLDLDLSIVGFWGDYYEFKPEAVHKVNNLV